MEHLTTLEAIRTSGRPIGKVDDARLTAYLTEAEQTFVKPLLGDALFLDVLAQGYDNEDYATLLNGGTYETEEEEKRSVIGLTTAISYYVYAQVIMTGDFQSTRYGMVVKQNDYSRQMSDKERSDAYGNTLEVAHNYLRECVRYCKDKKLIKKPGKVKGVGNVRIRKIG